MERLDSIELLIADEAEAVSVLEEPAIETSAALLLKITKISIYLLITISQNKDRVI